MKKVEIYDRKCNIVKLRLIIMNTTYYCNHKIWYEFDSAQRYFMK